MNLARRHFLGGLAALGASGMAAPLVQAQDRVPGSLGVNLFGLRLALLADLPGTLRTLRRMGLTRVEMISFRGWAGHPYGDFAALAPMTGQQVAAALADAGLTTRSSLVTPVELSPERLSATLDWMGPLGISTLTIAGLFPGDNAPAGMRQALEGLNRTGERLAEHGCSLMIHGDTPLWQGHQGTAWIDVFAAVVDPARCRIQLDLGATLQAGVDPLAILRRHGPLIGSMHVRDGVPPARPNAYVPSLALNEGIVPIAEVIDAALAAGIDDFVLEMAMQPAGGELAALERSLAFLREHRPQIVR